MNKYILAAFVALMSMSVMAGKRECNNYWKPLITKAKKEFQECQDEYRAILLSYGHPVYEGAKQAVEEKLGYFDDLLSRLKKARNLCFEYGLQVSKEAFDRS